MPDLNLQALIKRILFIDLVACIQAGFAQTSPSFPSTPHSMVPADGVRLVVQEWGNPKGPAILFIHAFAQSNPSWCRQVNDPALAAGYLMFTFDPLGHGSVRQARWA